MNIRVLTAILVLAIAGAASGAVTKTFRVEDRFPLVEDGTLLLENVDGNIEIVGADEDGVGVDVYKIVIGADAEAIEEGRQLTALTVSGDERNRILRTVVSPARTKQWSSTVYWRLRVPRTASVRVVAKRSGEFIRIFNIQGNVFVRNFAGTVTLENVTGFVNADSVNGSIVYNAPLLRGDVRLATVNGSVTARVRPDLDLRWIADTVRGDIRTNLPVRGGFTGTTFRGSVNAPGGPTLTTTSLMGHVFLLGSNMQMAQAKSVRNMRDALVRVPDAQRERVVGTLKREVVNGSLTYATNLGDIIIGQVRGNANVLTEAGQVQLGSVSGDCSVRSQGGSLQLGEIVGLLQASTRAGDIVVEAARRGGTISTTGGTIRLQYTGGPTRLTNGGGDVVVRQAAGPVTAETRSGDISVTVDRTLTKQTIDLQTGKGNILLNVGPQFGADVDLTVLTSDTGANAIQSELQGLSISREEVDGKTRVRATGKINGGGERVTMQATGSIRITTTPAGTPVVGAR